MNNDPGDFKHRGIWFYYRPHPSLFGNWEAMSGDDYEDTTSTFLGRLQTKKDCLKWANNPVKHKNLKYPFE